MTGSSNPAGGPTAPDPSPVERRLDDLAREVEQLRRGLRRRTAWLWGAISLLAAVTLTSAGNLLVPLVRMRTIEAREVVADRFTVRSSHGNPKGAASLGREPQSHAAKLVFFADHVPQGTKRKVRDQGGKVTAEGKVIDQWDEEIEVEEQVGWPIAEYPK